MRYLGGLRSVFHYKKARIIIAVSSVSPESEDRHTGRFYDLHTLCTLLGFHPETLARTTIDIAPLFPCARVKRGQSVFRMGQAFHALYVVRLGQVKTVLHGDGGDERVLGFSMKGDLLGFDGIYSSSYPTEAVALTDTELVVLPYRELLELGQRDIRFDKLMYLAASREMNRERAIESLQNTLKAEARVAWFIEYQADRFASQGYSSRQFLLPMTRRDIGNYLNISLETVSRSLSVLAAARIIHVDRREIHILRPEALHDFRPIRACATQEPANDDPRRSLWPWPGLTAQFWPFQGPTEPVPHAQGVLPLDTPSPARP